VSPVQITKSGRIRPISEKIVFSTGGSGAPWVVGRLSPLTTKRRSEPAATSFKSAAGKLLSGRSVAASRGDARDRRIRTGQETAVIRFMIQAYCNLGPAQPYHQQVQGGSPPCRVAASRLSLPSPPSPCCA